MCIALVIIKIKVILRVTFHLRSLNAAGLRNSIKSTITTTLLKQKMRTKIIIVAKCNNAKNEHTIHFFVNAFNNINNISFHTGCMLCNNVSEMRMLAMWETPELVQNKIDLNGPIKHRRADKHSSWDQNQHTHTHTHM